MKTDKHYISEIDKALTKFDQTHPKSASRQAEIDKHAHVFELRDYPEPPQKEEGDLFRD